MSGGSEMMRFALEFWLTKRQIRGVHWRLFAKLEGCTGCLLPWSLVGGGNRWEIRGVHWRPLPWSLIGGGEENRWGCLGVW